ncbi:MAG: ABC transporter substrate-binding protein [Aliarcobacter sp.]|nr:ABC transporter substrate-binding protein [Aliarcobacter sp.]
MKHLFFIFIISSFLYSNNLKSVSIQLKWKHQFQFAGFYMAKELGFYKDVGLDVEIKEFEKNTNIIDDITNQKSNFGIDDSSLIYHKLNGVDVVALFPIFQTSPITLITQENLKTLNSLENKNIEFSTNELANISIKAILKANNIQINQIPHTFVVNNFIAKKSDAIIGYSSNQPYYLDEKQIKYNIFNPKDFGFDFYGDMIFTSKEFAKNNPKIVSDFIKATKKGWEYAFSNIPQTIDFIYKNYNTQNKSKESLYYEANILKDLSGFGKNFAEIKEEKIKEIANIISLLFPQKYINTNLDDFIWNEKYELINYYKNNYLKQKSEFTVCIHDNMFPIDGATNGVLTGISGDILNKIANQFDLKLQIIQAKNIKDYLQNTISGKCDILSITAEDAYKQYGTINRSNSYLESNAVIITKIDKPFIENYSFLENKKFITRYKVFQNYLAHFYPEINIAVNTNIEDSMSKLENDDIDGYITDNITADDIIQKFGYGKFKISGILGLNKPLEGAFGVINSKPELLEIINLGLLDFNKKELEQLKEKWKVSRYTTVIDYSLIWEVISIFIIILLFILFFLVILKKHNKELNEWLNSTIEGIAIFENGELIKANKQLLTILGYDNFEEIYGKSHLDFIVPWEYHIIKEKLQFNQEPYEMTFIKKDGTKFDALVKGHQIDGTKNIRISTIIDISELKNTQRKLKKLNIDLEQKVQEELEKNKNQQMIIFQQSKLTEMGMMLNMIAHQWRQPLNNISLMVNTIILKQKKDHLTIENLDRFKSNFQEQINYLSNTIDDFKNFFKPKKEKELFILRDSILTTYSLVKPIFDKNQIQLNFNIDSKISYFGYKNEFSQVILNIINNSKDALIEKNIENKLIDIFVSLSQKDIIITIQDNANGVKNSDLEKIFELYYSTKKSLNGTGLGLYISKIIIQEHFNGAIIASNKNNGLEIIIKIPRN